MNAHENALTSITETLSILPDGMMELSSSSALTYWLLGTICPDGHLKARYIAPELGWDDGTLDKLHSLREQYVRIEAQIDSELEPDKITNIDASKVLDVKYNVLKELADMVNFILEPGAFREVSYPLIDTPRFAWVYGITNGWGAQLEIVSYKFGWSEEMTKRLLRLRKQYVRFL